MPDQPKTYVRSMMTAWVAYSAAYSKDPTTHVFIRDLKGMEDGVDEAFADVCRGASVNWSTLKAESQQSGRTKSRPIDPDWRN
jgi:benzoyl-CoA 2,3-epoxidase subunit A